MNDKNQQITSHMNDKNQQITSPMNDKKSTDKSTYE